MSVWVLLGLWLMVSIPAAIFVGKLIYFGMGEADADLE
ncbi:hypothetical protein [Bordetella phage CN1]|uniref:Uncharacterized protein n=1 Tax=Bordetella phage CN1 TaxID=1916123 RepID=A0A2D0W9V1_9CAUD|nr:hypothetical protein HOS29_gp55 [Bordetella phage CN1]APL99434.1 hypothetical protein [Bordetella phage CN1]